MSHAQDSRERTRNYFRQLRGSVLFKASAMAASFISLPMMIRYLGQEKFGIWATLLSIMSWVMFFDLGIGTGLRNKLAEALAQGEVGKASKYVSSGYSVVALVALGVFAIIAVSSMFVPWQSVFNTRLVSNNELMKVVLLTAFFVSINFITGLINQVLNALQLSSITNVGQFLSNFIALIGIYVLLTFLHNASLLLLAFVYGVSLLLSNLIVSLWLYNREKALVPNILLDKEYAKPLISLGGYFFIIQISILVIFATDKVIIAQMMGAQYVTQYEVMYRLFAIITIAHGLVMTPLWNAYTNAFAVSDHLWIRSTFYKSLMLLIPFALIVLIIAYFSDEIIAAWIGADMTIASYLVVAMAAFVLVQIWNHTFSCLLASHSKMRFSMVTALIGAMVNIPISIHMVSKIGVAGAAIASAMALSLSAVFHPIRAYYFAVSQKRNVYLDAFFR